MDVTARITKYTCELFCFFCLDSSEMIWGWKVYVVCVKSIGIKLVILYKQWTGYCSQLDYLLGIGHPQLTLSWKHSFGALSSWLRILLLCLSLYHIRFVCLAHFSACTHWCTRAHTHRMGSNSIKMLMLHSLVEFRIWCFPHLHIHNAIMESRSHLQYMLIIESILHL